MSKSLRCLALAAGLLATLPAVAVDQPVAGKARAQTVSLHVTVDAEGRVQAAQPSDPKLAPALNSAADAYARKLTFSPARKDGKAVSSETTLTLVLALEPRADGQYGLRLKRATNGPGVLEVGKTVAPRDQQSKENGALVVVGVVLQADGKVDMSTLTTERMELRVASEFAENRYIDAIKGSLRGTRFEPDKVDGVGVSAHISVPYQFGGGPAKPKPGEDERAKPPGSGPELEVPSLNAVSTVPGIDLARIDYKAPVVATEPAK